MFWAFGIRGSDGEGLVVYVQSGWNQVYSELQYTIRTSHTCPGSRLPSRDALLLRHLDQRLYSLADITRAGPSRSIPSSLLKVSTALQRCSNCCPQATVMRSTSPPLSPQSLHPPSHPSIRHKLFRSVGLHVSNKHPSTRCRNRARQSLYHTTERDLGASSILRSAQRGYPHPTAPIPTASVVS